ncbi:MAG: glycerophosphodiester phosphodiesterase family protein [Patescibacteria group bacterium]
MIRIGHRGASRAKWWSPRVGDNTPHSFARAAAFGAKGIELDVSRCGSGELVVIHDDAVDAKTNGSGTVESLSYQKIRELDCGGSFIPLLGETFFIFAKQFDFFNIEIKERDLVPDIVELIRFYGVEGKVCISCFDADDRADDGHKALGSKKRPSWSELLQVPPTIERALIVGTKKAIRIGREGLIEAAHEFGAKALHVRWLAVTPGLVELAHENDLLVRTWIVNYQPTMRLLESFGVDAIMTDVPSLLQP